MAHTLTTLGPLLLFLLALATPLALAAESAAEEAPPELQAAPAEEPPKPRLPLDELRVFAEAFNRVSSAYVEEIDDKALFEKAIRGFLAELDPHSAFLDSSSYSSLQETTRGNYGGLGLEVVLEDGFVKIVAPMDGTPAARAGLAPGDLILKLDGTPVKGMNLTDAVATMKGEAGSDITLTVLKAGESRPTLVTLTREIIRVPSVRHRLIDGLGYIRIAQFQKNTGAEVEAALKALMASTSGTPDKAVGSAKNDGNPAESDGSARTSAGDSAESAGDATTSTDGPAENPAPLPGLVLDLRSNPGGVLESGIAVADLFIDAGLIVYTQGRLKESERRYSAQPRVLAIDAPMVVLVNSGTASASEIVAGALQDHGRAVVMGTPTFGKGSVQTVLPLTQDRAIKLTTARYYTPNGRSIQAEGIAPDIFVAESEVRPYLPRGVKERDLPGHLEGRDGGEAKTLSEDGMELAQEDFPLYEALTLLKGLSILAKAPTDTTPNASTDQPLPPPRGSAPNGH